MEFGRVPAAGLDSIDFTLTAEPVENRRVLGGERTRDPKVYLGCAKWGRKEWVGKIYPAKTKEKDFLDHYVKHYNSIELNATHYKVYDETAIAKWAAKAAGRDFLFCPKMYNGVTHFGNLLSKEFITTEFLKGILAFGEHLGPVFVQVSDLFSPARKEELFGFLESLPSGIQFFLELRHASWFGDRNLRSELFGLLRELKIGAVITDTSGRRDCAHMELSIPKAFIRYVGNSLHPTDYTRIDGWIKRVKYWLDNGLQELYFFMHMHDETYSPELTVYLADQLNATCGLDLKKPAFIQTLF